MLKEWQFNVLFFVGVGGALFLLIGPELGLSISQNPTAVAGIGAILTYVLTQKNSITGEKKRKKHERERELENLEDIDEVYTPEEQENL